VPLKENMSYIEKFFGQEMAILQKWFHDRCNDGDPLVKISDAKAKFPKIHIMLVEQLFDIFTSQGQLVLEGKSRVKVFKIIAQGDGGTVSDHLNKENTLNKVTPSKRVINKSSHASTATAKPLAKKQVGNSNKRKAGTDVTPNIITILDGSDSPNRNDIDVDDNNLHDETSSSSSSSDGINMFDGSRVVVFEILYEMFECAELNGDGTVSVTDVCAKAVEAGCPCEEDARGILDFMSELNKIMIDGDTIYVI
jgi:hypothetical protein